MQPSSTASQPAQQPASVSSGRHQRGAATIPPTAPLQGQQQQQSTALPSDAQRSPHRRRRGGRGQGGRGSRDLQPPSQAGAPDPVEIALLSTVERIMRQQLRVIERLGAQLRRLRVSQVPGPVSQPQGITRMKPSGAMSARPAQPSAGRSRSAAQSPAPVQPAAPAPATTTPPDEPMADVVSAAPQPLVGPSGLEPAAEQQQQWPQAGAPVVFFPLVHPYPQVPLGVLSVEAAVECLVPQPGASGASSSLPGPSSLEPSGTLQPYPGARPGATCCLEDGWMDTRPAEGVAFYERVGSVVHHVTPSGRFVAPQLVVPEDLPAAKRYRLVFPPSDPPGHQRHPT